VLDVVVKQFTFAISSLDELPVFLLFINGIVTILAVTLQLHCLLATLKYIWL